MAYDAKRRKVVLFGCFRDCFHCDVNETWEYGLPPLRIAGITRQGDRLELRWPGGAVELWTMTGGAARTGPASRQNTRRQLSTGCWLMPNRKANDGHGIGFSQLRF